MEMGGIHDVLYHGSGLGGFLRDLPDRIARFRRIATYESGYARIGYRCRVRRGGCMADRAAGAGTPGRLRLRLFRRFGTAGKRLLRLSVGQPRKEREIVFRSIAVAVCRTGPLYRAGLLRFSVSGRCRFRCGIGSIRPAVVPIRSLRYPPGMHGGKYPGTGLLASRMLRCFPYGYCPRRAQVDSALVRYRAVPAPRIKRDKIV